MRRPDFHAWARHSVRHSREPRQGQAHGIRPVVRLVLGGFRSHFPLRKRCRARNRRKPRAVFLHTRRGRGVPAVARVGRLSRKCARRIRLRGFPRSRIPAERRADFSARVSDERLKPQSHNIFPVVFASVPDGGRVACMGSNVGSRACIYAVGAADFLCVASLAAAFARLFKSRKFRFAMKWLRVCVFALIGFCMLAETAADFLSPPA